MCVYCSSDASLSMKCQSLKGFRTPVRFAFGVLSNIHSLTHFYKHFLQELDNTSTSFLLNSRITALIKTFRTTRCSYPPYCQIIRHRETMSPTRHSQYGNLYFGLYMSHLAIQLKLVMNRFYFTTYLYI